ncbi:MAG: TonB-dependent receptor plug domain-containing protein [Erythrobacter sp.]
MNSTALALAAAVVSPAVSAEDNANTAPLEGSVITGEQGQIYTPEDFAQFAPRNALDMVRRVPGFTIEDGNRGQRGLGQANQNVIVNGERFSSKSDSVRDQLSRIPVDDVVRIEIVDGNSLDIPGLSGQVANIVYTVSATTGQFTWRTGFRPHNTEAQLYGGEASVAGRTGKLNYTLAVSNDNDRFGADGPTLITAADGSLIEEQFSKLSGKFDNPSLSANLTYDFGGETVANLNLSYGRDYFRRTEPETGISANGVVRERENRRREIGPEYEIGGDIEFPLGPGQLKLIGLERFERDDGVSTVIDRFSDGTDPQGFRFEQVNETGERIGRAEYGWNMWGIDWQVSGEAAFNRLNRASRLFEFQPDESFVELDFPAGTGGVTEDRYEAILSASTQLSSELSLQLTGGGEYSKIEQTGLAANTRTFQRPKGSVALAWKPQPDFDVSFEIRRRVGQLGFGDFLASVNLGNENQNGGNNELQPDQAWDFDLEMNKSFGALGSVKLEVRQAFFEDFVDFFPLPEGGEARGNIGNAQRTQVEVNATVNGDPLGLAGTRVELRAAQRWMNVTDPFTGEDRAFSNDIFAFIDVDFRHDIPGSDWAWGTGVFTEDKVRFFRRSEVGRDYEGPVFQNLFIEHKDVFGMTARATYANILGARNKFERTVFDGDRPDAPVLFFEDMDRRIGPIFRFSLSGNF